MVKFRKGAEEGSVDVDTMAGRVGSIVAEDELPIFVIAGGVDFARISLLDMEAIVAEMRRRAKR
jgi:hypothetical protein